MSSSDRGSLPESQAIAAIDEGLWGPRSIPVQLREGKGLDETALRRVREALELLAERWRFRSEVPKRVAAALVDIQSSMQASFDQYDEDEQDAIEDAANELVDLAYQLLVIPVEHLPATSEPLAASRKLFQFVPYREVARLPAGALLYDVSSRASAPFAKLSPFYPHGGIPVPGMPGTYSDSVEGVWQGLKVIQGEVDPSCFKGKGRKRRGRPEGHRFGEKLLGYLEARQAIYIPTYEFLWRECIGQDLRRHFFSHAAQGTIQYFHDRDNNGDPMDPSAPLAHASILAGLLAEEFARSSSLEPKA
jgi:hypothetical protein